MNAIAKAFFLSQTVTDESLLLMVSKDWRSRSIRWIPLLSLCGLFTIRNPTFAGLLLTAILVFVVAFYEQFEMRLILDGDSVTIERHPFFSDIAVESVQSADAGWNSNRIALTTKDGQVVFSVPPTFAFTRDWKHPGTRAVEWLNQRISHHES